MDNLDANKFNNFDEIDKFILFYLFIFQTGFERHKLPKLTQEEINIHNNSVSVKEIEFAVNYLPVKKMADPNGFTWEFCSTFEEEKKQQFSQSLPENQREGSNSPLIL